jgi:TPR repeat protein
MQTGKACRRIMRRYRKAAEQGDDSAQSTLGALYYAGQQGMPQDYSKAAMWFRKAADQGNAGAQVLLADMYYKGTGVGQDYAQAVTWYRKAPEQGDGAAQTALGAIYHDGTGVPQDYVQSYMWFNLAALGAESTATRDVAAQARNELASEMTPAQIAEAQRTAREWKPTK